MFSGETALNWDERAAARLGSVHSPHCQQSGLNQSGPAETGSALPSSSFVAAQDTNLATSIRAINTHLKDGQPKPLIRTGPGSASGLGGIERHRLMKGLEFSSSLARSLTLSPRRPEGEAKLQRQFEQVKGAYAQRSGKLRQHWYEGTLTQIAKKLSRDEEHFWFLRSFDSCIHAGPLAVFRGPTPAGADLMIFANNLVCRTAKRLVADAQADDDGCLAESGSVTAASPVARSWLLPFSFDLVLGIAE